jgi:hypothetical protein
MASDSVDFWAVLEEAELAVEHWPWWQQRYEADLSSEGEIILSDFWEAAL